MERCVATQSAGARLDDRPLCASERGAVGAWHSDQRWRDPFRGIGGLSDGIVRWPSSLTLVLFRAESDAIGLSSPSRRVWPKCGLSITSQCCLGRWQAGKYWNHESLPFVNRPTKTCRAKEPSAVNRTWFAVLLFRVRDGPGRPRLDRFCWRGDRWGRGGKESAASLVAPRCMDGAAMIGRATQISMSAEDVR